MEGRILDGRSKKIKNLYTRDIYALPDGVRAELIDGQIYYMAPPNTRHQRIVSDLHYRIKDFIYRNSGDCEVFPAPFAVFLNGDDETYVEPDISIICDKNKIIDKGCNARLTGLLRLFHLEINRWIISQSFSNIGLRK